MAVPKEFIGMVEELRKKGKTIEEIRAILPKYDSVTTQKQVSRAWVYSTIKKLKKLQATGELTPTVEVTPAPEVKTEEPHTEIV